MKKPAGRIAKFLRQYARQFAEIFSAPKAYFRRHDFTRDEAVITALLFVGASLVIVEITRLLSIAGALELWTFVAGQAVFWLVYIVIGGALTFLTWRLVGGSAPPRAVFIIYAYALSIAAVIAAAFHLVATGIMRTFEPARYSLFVDVLRKHAAFPPGTFDALAMRTAAAVLLLGIGCTLVWLLIAWGAFREVNKTGRLRSAIALTIILLLTIPTLFALTFMSNALY